MYLCPVCGYDRMLRPPSAGYICPCCGVQFELDDDEVSHAELRSRWVARGMPWFSNAIDPPDDWNPVDQLNRISPVVTVSAVTTTVSRDVRREERLEQLVPAYIIANLHANISVSGASDS